MIGAVAAANAATIQREKKENGNNSPGSSPTQNNRSPETGKMNEVTVVSPQDDNEAPRRTASKNSNDHDLNGEPTIPWSEIKHGEGFWYYQPHASWLYQHQTGQIVVACIIGLNFVTNVVEAQIDPDGLHFVPFFSTAELIFTVVFTIELSVNMYSSWFWGFWMSNWNRFDFLVVAIGICNASGDFFPPELSILRNMRAFRVFRLLKKIESFYKILVSIARAIPGVLSACLIVIIVMSIYAILAVDLFRLHGCVCPDGGTSCSQYWLTLRGDCLGLDYFGDFLTSFYSLFQVLTGDSWSEAIVRPMLHVGDNSGSAGISDVMEALLFVSYTIITGWVLINVVVAVLLSKMVAPGPIEEEEAPTVTEEADKAAGGDVQGKLFPLSDEEVNVYRNGHWKQAIYTGLTSDIQPLHDNIMNLEVEVDQNTKAFESELDSLRDDVRRMKDGFNGIKKALAVLNVQKAA